MSSQPLSQNKHLLRWVEKMADLTTPAAIHWVDGSQEEYDRLCDEMVAKRHVHQAEPGPVARLLLRAFRCDGRCARRRSHVYLLAVQRQRGSDEQLGKSVRDAEEAEGACSRAACRGERCMCCRSAWDRSVRRCRRSACSLLIRLTSSSTCASWRASGCRSFEEIDKDEKRVVPCMHTVGAPLAPGQEDVPWPCNQGEVHRPFSRDARNLVLRLGLRRQCAARQEMLRAADRFEHGAR